MPGKLLKRDPIVNITQQLNKKLMMMKIQLTIKDGSNRFLILLSNKVSLAAMRERRKMD